MPTSWVWLHPAVKVQVYRYTCMHACTVIRGWSYRLIYVHGLWACSSRKILRIWLHALNWWHLGLGSSQPHLVPFACSRLSVPCINLNSSYLLTIGSLYEFINLVSKLRHTVYRLPQTLWVCIPSWREQLHIYLIWSPYSEAY